MTPNPFSHIDLRVNDRKQARAFYSQLLPPLGFTEFSEGKLFDTFTAGGSPPSQPWFGYTEDPDHRPNGNRIAFWVPSRADVDRLTETLKSAGAKNISGPKTMPEYDNTYYAVFFDDPFDNPLEIYHG